MVLVALLVGVAAAAALVGTLCVLLALPVAVPHVFHPSLLSETTPQLSADAIDESLRHRFNLSSLLLPVPLELRQRGIPLSSVYQVPEPRIAPHPTIQGCSCNNPSASTECCTRTIVKSHKMGVMLVSKLFRIHRRVTEIAAIWGARWSIDRIPSHTDFRDVLVLRNLYGSLVSGYLYHKSGRECWLDPDGRPGHVPREPFELHWDAHLVHPLPVPRHNRSLCEYLATESPAHGLRAYVEWAFGVHYRKTLAHLTLSQELPVLRNRTMVVCFEQLTADPVASSDAMLSFVFHRPPPFPRAWGSADAGGHATHATPEERDSLVREIEQLDRSLYGGDIAYAHSVIPC